MLAYGSAALTGSVAGLRAFGTLSWSSTAIDITGFAAYSAVAILRGRQLQTRASSTP